MPERQDYFSSICRVSRAFGTTLNREKLLDLIVESAIDTMKGKAACLFLRDENRETELYYPITQKGLSKSYLHAEPKEARRAAEEILKKGYIAIHDAVTDSRVQNHKLKKSEGIASILVVPVLVRDEVIGVLSLYTAEKRMFSADEIAFLTALAEQGGMAIEKARLVEQIRKNTRLFHDLALGMNSSLDIKNIMEIMTEGIAKAFGVKAATVGLLNKDQESLQLIATYGLSEKYLGKGSKNTDRSFTAALDGDVMQISDVAAAKEVHYKKEKKEEGIAAILSVPIKAKDDIIGVLRLYSAVPRVFTEDEIMLATAIAHQGGLAINNASCVLVLQEDLKDLKKDLWSHRSWF